VTTADIAGHRMATPVSGRDGARTDGARTDGARTDGARTDGARTDGARKDGARTDGPRRAELGSFLKACRARLRPEDLGLAPGPRRRTPGLRREEVALL